MPPLRNSPDVIQKDKYSEKCGRQQLRLPISLVFPRCAISRRLIDTVLPFIARFGEIRLTQDPPHGELPHVLHKNRPEKGAGQPAHATASRQPPADAQEGGSTEAKNQVF